MLTAMRAVDNLVQGAGHDIWSVNAESVYHEEIRRETQPYIDAPADARDGGIACRVGGRSSSSWSWWPRWPASPEGDATRRASQTTGSGGVRLVEVATGLESPMQTVALPGDGGLLVVEQPGRVRLRARTAPSAGHPCSTSRRAPGAAASRASSPSRCIPTSRATASLYLHLSDPDGDTRIEEYRFHDGAIDPEPTRVLLQVDQPYPNHNGGSLAFGPDGMLYLGLGDGGGAFDPEGNSQNLASRLGKLLRLDVDTAGAEWEIAAYGLRNPWRFAFDPATGDAWIGDVGQDDQEEVDVFPKGSGR